MMPRDVGEEYKAMYLDLERLADLTKVRDFELSCRTNPNQMVILDEVQSAPEIFPLLRGITDEKTRWGQRIGQFLLLGSASLKLLQQSSESLAERINAAISGPKEAEFR